MMFASNASGLTIEKTSLRGFATLSARLTEYHGNSGLAARERLLEATAVVQFGQKWRFMWGSRLQRAQDDVGTGLTVGDLHDNCLAGRRCAP
jgi:hypothetical protein